MHNPNDILLPVVQQTSKLITLHPPLPNPLACMTLLHAPTRSRTRRRGPFLGASSIVVSGCVARPLALSLTSLGGQRCRARSVTKIAPSSTTSSRSDMKRPPIVCLEIPTCACVGSGPPPDAIESRNGPVKRVNGQVWWRQGRARWAWSHPRARVVDGKKGDH